MYIFLTLISNKSNWPKLFYTVIQVWLLCQTCENVLHRTNTGSVLLTSPYKPGANLYKEFISFQQITLKSRRVAKYEYIKENEPEESVHEVTREENFIDVDTATCTNKESELLDLDHLVSIHLLFSPSSQIKTVGRNCEIKVVGFSCGMYILYQDIKLGPSIY